MINTTNNQRIIFLLPEDVTMDEIIFSILKNNELEETSEEACEKSIKGELSRLIIIRDVARDLAEKKVSERDLIQSLRNQLEIPEEKAEKLVSNIKERIIPFAKEVMETESNMPQKESNIATKIKPPIGTIQEEIIKREVIKPLLKTPQRIKKPPVLEKGKEVKEFPKKSDAYREPIE